jgi:hypothetical protein
LSAPTAESKRPGSVPLLVGLVLLVMVIVVGSLPLIKCPSQDCYTQIQENLRCLSVAKSGPYPDNVRRYYEAVLRDWPCEECHGRGRISFLYLCWQILQKPSLSKQ